MLSVLDRFNLVNSEAQALKEFLDSLGADGLNHSSACDGWQNADVVGHLIWVGELYTKVVNRALRGITDLPEDAPQVRSNSGLSQNEYIDQQSRKYRQDFADQLTTAFSLHFHNLYRVMMGMSLEERELPCHYPRGLHPVWSMANMAVQELAIHHWDIRSGLDPQAHLSPGSQDLLLERLEQRGPRRLQLDAGPGPVRIRFEFSGPVSGRYDIVLEGTEGSIQTSGAEVAPVTIECAAEDFILLMFGRLSYSAAIAEGHFAASGDTELAAALVNNFS